MFPSQLSQRIAAPIVIAAIALAAVAVPPVAASTGPYLVKDINTSGSSLPGDLAEMGGVLYFSAKGGGKGRELWRSDGTATGTRRVKDIRAGSAASSPWSIEAIGSRIYFSADDGIHGRELWVSDGTAAGTRLVKDINPGAGGSEPWGFIAYNGRVYFSARDASKGRELWRTDGTAGGTVRVKDIAPGTASSSPGGFVPFAGKLFFTRQTCVNFVCTETLFRSDGTAAGTKPFRDSTGNKITGQGVDWLTVAGSRLFFIVNENELWRSSGTPSTTKRIASRPAWNLTAVGSRVYFESGEQLWKSDGTVASTSLVRDFEYSGIDAPVAVNGKLFFFAYGEPWTSDGTTAGTQPVGKQVQTDTDYAVLGSVIYFGGWEWEAAESTASFGPSFTPAPTLTLWRSDGTAAGTYSVGPPDAHLHSPTAVGSSIFFVANAGGYGSELWRYVP